MQWRRVRDSNPQALSGAGFQDRCNSHSANSPQLTDAFPGRRSLCAVARCRISYYPKQDYGVHKKTADFTTRMVVADARYLLSILLIFRKLRQDTRMIKRGASYHGG